MITCPEEAKPEPKIVVTTKKGVFGEAGKKYDKGTRLTVGKDVKKSTAAKMVQNGVAIFVDGLTQKQVAEAKTEATAANNMVQQKQRATREMARFDRMNPEDREFERDRDPDEGADVI